MYIISKFKDYYDTALGVTGIDKSIVFERKEIEIEDIPIQAYRPVCYDEPKWYHRGQYIIHLSQSQKIYSYVDYFLVGFCGKYYLGFRFYRQEGEGVNKTYVCDIKYDLDEVRSLLNLENYRKKWKSRRYGDSFEQMIKAVSEYNDDTVFRQYKSPCFVYYWKGIPSKMARNGNYMLTINPCLKDFEFAKAIDPYTAFQEVQMYISGVLGLNEKELIVVSDKDRIASHGFDKWSFRKPPEND